MAERLLQMTGFVICQFLLLVLTPLALLLTLVNSLLRQVQRDLEQSTEKPVHIHYELHQHVHVAEPTAYQKTLDDVSRHLPVPLQQVRVLPAPVKVRNASQPSRSLGRKAG